MPKHSQSWALPDVPAEPDALPDVLPGPRFPSQVALGDEGSEALEPGSCRALPSLLSKPEELQQDFPLQQKCLTCRKEGREDASLVCWLRFGF